MLAQKLFESGMIFGLGLVAMYNVYHVLKNQSASAEKVAAFVAPEDGQVQLVKSKGRAFKIQN